VEFLWGRKKSDAELWPFSRIDMFSFTVNALTMYAEWIAAEHYRLHVIEEWPEGPRKAVALSAIQIFIAEPLAEPPTPRFVGGVRNLFEPGKHVRWN
jgi:hypothetical protein